MNSSTHRASGRRGAILLIAISALTLFAMVGTLMLVTATRTRAAARAFANLTASHSVTTTHADAMLDEALLFVLRGSKDETKFPATLQKQSLLEDKYGPSTVSGTAVAGSVRYLTEAGPMQGKPVILEANVFVSGAAPFHACDFNGRVITFKPAARDGDIASYRILRTVKKPGNSAPFTFYFADLASNRRPTLPRQTCDVVINGREFTPENPGDENEPHDGFDAANAWLAHVKLGASKVTEVIRPSFGTTGTTAACDNDNDGVADGIWISGLVPDKAAPGGGLLKHDFSFHIVDLDGRININAHGSPALAAPKEEDWPATFASSDIKGVPVGLGYGPSDLDASRLFSSGSQQPGLPGWRGLFDNLCRSGSSSLRSGTSGAQQRRPQPYLAGPLAGRYGSDWIPGHPDAVVDPLLQCSIGGTVSGTGAASKVTVEVGASPTDLHAKVKMFVQEATTGSPTLTFYVSSGTSSSDMRESPYGLRLDTDAPRPQASGRSSAIDDPFTLTELERILRQFDSDAANLPSRLAALLDDFAERSRMTITTDSWDVPVISGSAMTCLSGTMRKNFAEPTVIVPSAGPANAATVYDVFSPDVSAGLRFDLNRPLVHPAVATSGQSLKERYCRHLYTLLVALGQPPNKATAQWVANVVDFRDADSTMTRFRYDTNPWDGWTASDSTYVFGAERPELVFTESVAWPENLTVVLYHPWDARVVDRGSAGGATNGFLSTERVDPNLASADAPNMLDPTRKQGTDSVWQVRVGGGATVSLAAQAGAAADGCRLNPNEYLCVSTQTTAVPGIKSIRADNFLPVASDGGRGGMVYLERLADPSKPLQANPSNKDFNPYVIVDEVPIVPAPEKTLATKMIRDASAFWTRRTWLPGKQGDTTPSTYARPIPWFHWPNRPFVGAAELALVPTGDASSMLASATIPSPARSGTSLILDAVHVPSRFAGTTLRIGEDPLLQMAAASENICTTLLPRWREPGRVNVNTVVSNTANSADNLNNGVWQALIDVGGPANPFNGSDAVSSAGDVAPAKSVGEMLTLRTGPDVFSETPAAPRNADDFFAYARSIRLSNAATIRSHLFAVWITVRITDTSAAPVDPLYRRAFAIIDRSIPVGFARGETLNVRDAIRLLRFLD